MIGYLNFSAGKPDARFHRELSELYQVAGPTGFLETLRQSLDRAVESVRGTSAAFQDLSQAEAVVSLVFDLVLPAYREHHRDLLSHLTDAELYQPFFLARVFEAVLSQGGPWHERDRIVRDTLQQLNDFIGHRPVAMLERHRCEPYDHERVRPIPVFIHGSGVAAGPYHGIVSRALEILQATDAAILTEACFDLHQLDELAIDPRAYDFAHPVNQRPNYQFGEWDPHLIDNKGFFRRFVVRKVTLDSLLQRSAGMIGSGNTQTAHASSAAIPGSTGAVEDLPYDELLTEAAAVLAGTMLMASGTSGRGPETYDSSVTLATLVPRIARYRDAFYDRLLSSVPGAHGHRLREEAVRLHQPFGAARQHLNRTLAGLRAAQLQHVRLAHLFARMGHPQASAEHAGKIPTASARLECEIEYRIASAHLHLDRGGLDEAEQAAIPLRNLLDRGIACGAMLDPWNILGFQGQFSVFPALENSVPDPRVDQLVGLVDQMQSLLARLMTVAAGAGADRLCGNAEQQLGRLASWWDRFATVEVSSVRPVRGAECLDSARCVVAALRAWRQAGEGAGDIRFWRDHSTSLQSPRAYAQVLRVLMDRQDHLAALALLMSWLSLAAELPLEQGHDSFHSMAVSWLSGVLARLQAESSSADRHAAWTLVRRFFELLEANAAESQELPSLQFGRSIDELAQEELAGLDGESADTFESAYEGVTYRDSAEDGQEGELLEGGTADRGFELEAAQQRIEPRLRLIRTVARLIELAVTEFARSPARILPGAEEPPRHPESAELDSAQLEVFRSWRRELARRDQSLASLLDAVHAHPVPQPIGSHDSLVEFDRRRMLKHSLTMDLASTQLETRRALHCLWSYVPDDVGTGDLAEWERLAIATRRVVIRGEPAAVANCLPRLLGVFSELPLLYARLDKGGHASQIVAARTIQNVMKTLVEELPRLGMLRESFQVLKTARTMEQNRPAGGEAVTEFDRLFRAALEATSASLLDAALSWNPPDNDQRRVLDYLEQVCEPFLKLWLEHSQTIRLSAQDRVPDADWDRIRHFVQSYGHDLFTPKFLALGNLRAILAQGVPQYFEYQEQDRDPLHPIRLIDELDDRISRQEAARLLELVLHLFVGNYEEYRDYNTTTAQSDYGERYFILFEFLRLKAWYERTNWNLEPVRIVHEVLVRQGRGEAAHWWQEAVADKTTELANSMLDQLAQLEARYGVRLNTIRDRLADRFVRPMVLDRIRLLIRPAMREVCGVSAGPEPVRAGAIDRFLAELRLYAETTTGAGLDVPEWLRILESEVEQARIEMQGGRELLAEDRPPQIVLFTPSDLDRQLDGWDQPL